MEAIDIKNLDMVHVCIFAPCSEKPTRIGVFKDEYYCYLVPYDPINGLDKHPTKYVKTNIDTYYNNKTEIIELLTELLASE